MSTWPSNLPPPLRTVEIRPGRNAQAITQASGRRIVRNWGHRPADQVTVQFRIYVDDEPAFNYFWHRTGMDMTWFTADWLAYMGYTDHKARIVGYPRRKGITGKWMDFAVTLLVKASSLCVDSEPWPAAGTGSSNGSPSPGTEGDVVGWGYDYSSIITNVPTDLRGIKVDCSSYPRSSDPGSGRRGVYVGVLQTDGTIIHWGSNMQSWASGIAALSGVLDFVFVRDYNNAGMYYITSSGYIAHIGTPSMGTSYPTNSGFTKLYNHHTWILAENEDGDCYYWTTSYSGTLSGVTAPLTHVTFGWSLGSSPSSWAAAYNSTLIVDSTGEASVWQTYNSSAPSRKTAVEPTINSGIICGSHGASGCMVCYDDYDWWGYDETQESFTDIPVSLEPIWMRTFHDDSSTLALNGDGTVVGWGTDRYGTISSIPANLKAHQMCVKTVLIDYQTAFAIKIDE